MATGLRPFNGASPASVYGAILHEVPRPPLQLNPQLPVELERIITKALEKDRDLRCQTAAEMRADLKRVKRDMDSSRSASTVAGPALASAAAGKAGGRSLRAPVLLGLGILLGLIVGIVVGKRTWPPPLRPSRAIGRSLSAAGQSRRRDLPPTDKPFCIAPPGKAIPWMSSRDAWTLPNPVLCRWAKRSFWQCRQAEKWPCCCDAAPPVRGSMKGRSRGRHWPAGRRGRCSKTSSGPTGPPMETVWRLSGTRAAGTNWSIPPKKSSTKPAAGSAIRASLPMVNGWPSSIILWKGMTADRWRLSIMKAKRKRWRAASTPPRPGMVPDGKEVWFTGSRVGANRALYAVSLDGRERLVSAMPGTLILMDIWKDGRILLIRATWRRELLGVFGAEGYGDRPILAGLFLPGRPLRRWAVPAVR